MKSGYINVVGIALLSIACASCAPPADQEKDEMPIVAAVEKSLAYAKRDRVDENRYIVKYAAISANGNSRAIDRQAADDYQISILKKLHGRRYWEVCYGASEPGMTGATYCYYLDSSKYELIADYQVK
jgi:hypothetical protein